MAMNKMMIGLMGLVSTVLCACAPPAGWGNSFCADAAMFSRWVTRPGARTALWGVREARSLRAGHGHPWRCRAGGARRGRDLHPPCTAGPSGQTLRWCRPACNAERARRACVGPPRSS